MGKAASVIMECLKEKGITQRHLSFVMGEDVRNINQQLHRQQDIKVERFVDVLDYLGYRLEIIDNDGIRKVGKDYARQIIDTRQPQGKFWCEDEDFVIVGIDNSNSNAWVEEFSNKEECFKWLKGEPCVDLNGLPLNK